MNTWREAVGLQKTQPYFQALLQRVAVERNSGEAVYPPQEDVFNAFRYTEFSAVKVVVLGQDPYHNVNQAHGLSFSVRHGIAPPPSLVNIYKELSTDIADFRIPDHGCLTHWAEEGVLLLNTVLTVRAHQAHSHRSYGWETFTDCVIDMINREREHVVFLLWGTPAQKKGARIDRSRHLVLSAPHPSPLSAHRGFFGCRHFSQANAYLRAHGIAPVAWQL